MVEIVPFFLLFFLCVSYYVSLYSFLEYTVCL